eukprot:7620057-Alexandrium_andersonii.AAC.1
MSASLVGSEMCIRDSGMTCRDGSNRRVVESLNRQGGQRLTPRRPGGDTACLLYTSDAADDM